MSCRSPFAALCLLTGCLAQNPAFDLDGTGHGDRQRGRLGRADRLAGDRR
jgi:hypothetical protein